MWKRGGLAASSSKEADQWIQKCHGENAHWQGRQNIRKKGYYKWKTPILNTK